MPKKDFLKSFGWDPFFEAHYAELLQQHPDLIPARIIGEEKNLYRVQFDHNHHGWASIAGKLRFQNETRKEFPATGDWVLCKTGDHSDDRAVIHFILPRKSVIMRKQPGRNQQAQVIASNVNYLMVTTSLNADLNLKRLDRYFTLAWDSGAIPFLVLTKSDLVENAPELTAEMESHFPMVEVKTVTVLEPETMDALKPYFDEGITTAVIGSSGVGKSTLINHFIGNSLAKTQDIREGDAKGRHTTTARHLYQTKWGGLVMDTPGMRQMKFVDNEEGLKTHFEEIESLAGLCKFGDCRHETEPGCAILEALGNGELQEERWQSYLKQLREIHFYHLKNDKHLASEEKKKWKRVHKALKVQYKLRSSD